MGSVNLKLRKMTDEEFDKFAEWDIIDYSKELIKAGLSSEDDAIKDAKKSFDDFLPQGNHTKDNYIYVIANDNNDDIGFIWYQKFEEDIAFICDFLIIDKFRRCGYGRQTLFQVEKDAKEKGLKKILLNVFKSNVPAFSLYKSLNYEIRDQEGENISMIKDI